MEAEIKSYWSANVFRGFEAPRKVYGWRLFELNDFSKSPGGHKIGTNEMLKEKGAIKKIPLSYLELVVDKLRYNQPVRIENAFQK